MILWEYLNRYFKDHCREGGEGRPIGQGLEPPGSHLGQNSSGFPRLWQWALLRAGCLRCHKEKLLVLKRGAETALSLPDENTEAPDEDVCLFCYSATSLVSSPFQNIAPPRAICGLEGLSIWVSSSSLDEGKHEATRS